MQKERQAVYGTWLLYQSERGILSACDKREDIRIAVAHRNEEKINARGMVKSLIIGIIIIFVIAVGAPFLINGLNAWVGADAGAEGASIAAAMLKA